MSYPAARTTFKNHQDKDVNDHTSCHFSRLLKTSEEQDVNNLGTKGCTATKLQSQNHWCVVTIPMGSRYRPITLRVPRSINRHRAEPYNSRARSIKEQAAISIPRNHVSEFLRKEGTNGRQASVDFETAITNAGFGKFNIFLLLVSLPAHFSAGMVAGSIAFVIPSISCDFAITNFEKGVLQLASYFGTIVAAFFWGSASDSFGRKKLLTYGFLLDGLAGIGASLSPTFWMMVVFKVLNGALNSGPSSIFVAYLSEIFLKEHRDIAVLSSGMFSALGNILQPE